MIEKSILPSYSTRISLQAVLPLAGFSFLRDRAFHNTYERCGLKRYVAAYWRCNTPVRLFDGLQSAAQPIYHCVSGGQLGEHVTSIGSAVFQDCSGLTSVTIPESVTSIGPWAFIGCSSLTSVTIPSSVTSIGAWVFDGCESLTSINVTAGNPTYSSVDGVLFSADQTLLYTCPDGKIGTYIIPASVTTIVEDAFAWCDGLTTVTIPNSVTSIGMNAFLNCSSLTSVTIPDSVTSIGLYAFSDCTRPSGEIVWRCASRVEHGKKFCKQSPSISEESIKEIICDKLGMSTFDEDQIKNQIDTILVHTDGRMQIELQHTEALGFLLK